MPRPADHRRPGRARTTAVGVALGALLAVAPILGGCGAGDRLTDVGSDPGTRRTAPSPADRAPADGAPADRPPGRERPDRSAPPTRTGTTAPASALPAVPTVPVRSASLAGIRASAVVPPVRLDVPALGIAVPVDAVGVASDGQMEIPPLAERAGWYRFGSAPGEPVGTAVVAAHVDSVASAGLGPFARLRDAAVGDAVDVTLADGAVRRFAVTSVERRAKPEITWSDVFVRDGAPRLVLVTCGGRFQRDVGHYSDNVVVTAVPVGG